MKSILAIAALSLASTPAALAQMAMMVEPSDAVQTCLTKHAGDVEEAIESLDEATNFLLQKICASELADQYQTWSIEQRQKEAAEQQARIKAMCESRTPSPTSSDSEIPRAQYADIFCDGSDGELLSLVGGTSILWSIDHVSAPKATAFAARTLLQIRMQRLQTRQ